MGSVLPRRTHLAGWGGAGFTRNAPKSSRGPQTISSRMSPLPHALWAFAPPAAWFRSRAHGRRLPSVAGRGAPDRDTRRERRLPCRSPAAPRPFSIGRPFLTESMRSSMPAKARALGPMLVLLVVGSAAAQTPPAYNTYWGDLHGHTMDSPVTLDQSIVDAYIAY